MKKIKEGIWQQQSEWHRIEQKETQWRAETGNEKWRQAGINKWWQILISVFPAGSAVMSASKQRTLLIPTATAVHCSSSEANHSRNSIKCFQSHLILHGRHLADTHSQRLTARAAEQQASKSRFISFTSEGGEGQSGGKQTQQIFLRTYEMIFVDDEETEEKKCEWWLVQKHNNRTGSPWCFCSIKKFILHLPCTMWSTGKMM